MKPPTHITSFSSRICSSLPILETDSEKRKFVDSILLSVIIGQSSSEIVSDLIPLFFKIRFKTCDIKTSPENANAFERISSKNSFLDDAKSIASFEFFKNSSIVSLPKFLDSSFRYSKIFEYDFSTIEKSKLFPFTTLSPIPNTTSVSDFFLPSTIVSGAEQTTTSLPFF